MSVREWEFKTTDRGKSGTSCLALLLPPPYKHHRRHCLRLKKLNRWRAPRFLVRVLCRRGPVPVAHITEIVKHARDNLRNTSNRSDSSHLRAKENLLNHLKKLNRPDMGGCAYCTTPQQVAAVACHTSTNVEKMREIEGRYGEEIPAPIVVYSDLTEEECTEIFAKGTWKTWVWTGYKLYYSNHLDTKIKNKIIATARSTGVESEEVEAVPIEA